MAAYDEWHILNSLNRRKNKMNRAARLINWFLKGEKHNLMTHFCCSCD